jgi:glycosyltransferase involved in cell wall biosynthesis
MFLINPSNKLVGVSESRVDELLKQGFRIPADKKEEESKRGNNEKPTPEVFATKIGLPIRMLTSVNKPDGYGQSQQYLTRSLKENGIDVQRTDKGQEIGLCYYTPVFQDRLKTPIKVIYSMFESTTIPSGWVKHLKKADKVFVPSKFCQKSFATRGIESTVVPLGYNDEVYKYIERSKHEEFTFLHYNAFNMRKGFDLVFKAFTEEFKVEEPVKLVLKTISNKSPFPILKSEYPNIEVQRGEYTHAQMHDLLESADAFLFPSRGEGFGLTPLEALATGLPVLIPNSSGMSEYFDKEYFYEVKVEGSCPPVYQSYPAWDVGTMVEPSLEDLKKQMRYVYEHQAEAKEKGRLGADWVKKNWSIDKTGRLLAKELKEVKKKIISTEIPDIAFLTEDIHFYSGGRYHSWIQALMLTESKYRTVIYTNEIPCFKDDFDLYETPEIKIIGHDPKDQENKGALAFNVLDVEAGAYFGSPATASLNACRLGLKYHKPVYVTMFDPPTWVLKSSVCQATEIARDIRLKEFLDAHLEELPEFKLIVLTENSIDDYASWYGLDKKYIIALHPAVNSRLIALFDKDTERMRGEHIVTCSRNHPRKGFEDVLYAFKPFSRDHYLHIITSSEDGIMTKVINMGIPSDKVIIHEGISDTEKFRIFAQSKVLLSGSKFEGFGMWATEARAMGLPVVCYDLEPLKELYNDAGMFKAKCFDKDDLRDKLSVAIASKPLKPETDHNFEVLQEQILKTVKPVKEKGKPLKVTPMFIVLNEEKFIEASLRAVLRRKEVAQVIVVEGADRRYPSASSEGLSTDSTSAIIKKIKKEFPKRVIYEQVGWVDGKEALRQKCIDLSDHEGWGLFVDGDEVWGDPYWSRLMEAMKENPEIGVIYFKHLHFWKQPDLVAVGSQWESRLFRCFRFAEKDLKIVEHAGEPNLPVGGKLGGKYGRIIDNTVKLHHYGAMKNKKDILDKLEFYKKRDTNLEVKDTWSEWKEGEPTQWTQGNGTVKKYTGSHPKEVQNVLQSM